MVLLALYYLASGQERPVGVLENPDINDGQERVKFGTVAKVGSRC